MGFEDDRVARAERKLAALRERLGDAKAALAQVRRARDEAILALPDLNTAAEKDIVFLEVAVHEAELDVVTARNLRDQIRLQIRIARAELYIAHSRAEELYRDGQWAQENRNPMRKATRILLERHEGLSQRSDGPEAQRDGPSAGAAPSEPRLRRSRGMSM